MLSGGMKRRLSLLLACLGDPCVLLLDEPTSGCDSFTRELVRKDIIGRKHSCAILISTHHIDDVEIISDKVWFLNEHSLIYNGPLVNLHDEQQQQGQSSYYQARPAPGTSALQSRSEFLSSFVEFSTSSHSVMENFLRIFPDQPPSSLTSSTFGTIHSWSISMNSHRNRATLHQFIESLESQGNSQWSIVSPNAYKSLSRMYDITETKYQLGDPLEETHGETPGAGHTSSWGNISWERILLPEWFVSSQFGLACRRCYHLLKLRVLEVKSQSSQFLISQLLLPFFIVLFLVFACGDVRYPKLELQSASIGGIGEILIANGGYRNRSSVDLESVLVMESESLRMKELDHSLMTDATPAAAVCNDSLVWKGAKSSDELFTELSEEYFRHTSNRWASFVLDDTVDQWLQSRVRIPKGSLQLSFDQIMDTLSDLRETICQNFTTQQDPTATGSSREGSRGGNSGVSSMVSSHKIQFCSQLLSSIEFSVVNETMVPSSTHGSSNVTTSTVSGGEEGGVHEVFMITVYQSLHANLTMMTNISTDHSSPIFLKEIAPYIYSSFQSNPPHPPLASNSSSPSSSSASSGFLNTRKEIGTPSYSLFSHPFDDATDSSSTYIERGYLGALMIILYLLLVSSVSVKFITNNNSSGVKTQVHLCGVSPLLYWLSNFIADSLSLFLSYLCIFLAILFGGAPIRNFFFLDDSGSLFLLSLLVFSFASVASNYSLAVLSKDQISSQLLSLVSSICCGLFLKFFISLQGTISPYPLISTLCTLLSPSYALTSCLFELFTRYVKQLGKSVGIIERDVVLDLNAIYFPISVMCAQTIAYLLLTILIDTHWYPLLCSLQSAWDSCSSSLYSSFSSSVLLRRTRSLSTNLHVSIRERLFQYIHLAASQDSPPPSFVPPLSSPSHSSLHTSPLPSPSIGRGLEKAIISSMTPPSSPQLQRHPAMSHGSSHALLSLQNLSVKYPLATTEALKSLNLELSSGERVALMGINGGGKSSLFKTLSTTETIPVSGSAHLCHCHTVHDHWRLGQVSAVGYVPQEGGLLEYLTVREVLDFFGGLRSQNRDTHHPRHPPALALVGSTSGSTRGSSTSVSILPKKYESYLIQSLSGGNKKKLSVVLSNLNSPAILLLDEPSSGVDPAAAERIVSYLSNLPRDQSILYASHRLDECLRICHRVLMLYGGRMQFDGNLTVLDSISDLFYQIDVQLFLLPPSVASSSSSRSFSSSSSPERAQQMIAMGDFLELLRQSFQKVLRGETQRQREGKGGQGGEEEGQKGEGDVLERAVVYNESLVRITLEKNRIPFSSAWTIFEQFSVEGLIQKYSFRKMDLEEIFAIILSTDSLPPPQSVATHPHREHEEEQR
jgi:ABC-2 type transport system ATP-binding protein